VHGTEVLLVPIELGRDLARRLPQARFVELPGLEHAPFAGPHGYLEDVRCTVKDLVVGSGLRFEDRGMHTLKGLPDEWRLFAASNGA